MELQPNHGKNLVIEIDGKQYARYPIKTKLITPEDKHIIAIIEQFAKPHVQPGDILFISEKAVAITQGRSYPLTQIKPSWLAKQLSRFVLKTPVGIGLGSPQTMQLAIEEVGVPRILVAAIIGGLGKVVSVRGLFYMVAGNGARSIDGAVPYAIPPYNTYVSKGPANAQKIAAQIAECLGVSAAIVDANDLGVNVLGASESVDKKFIVRAIDDNPLGQSDEQTPIGIIRQVHQTSEGIVRQATLADIKSIVEAVELLRIDIPKFVWADEEFIRRQIANGEYVMIEKNGTLVGVMSMRVRNHKMHIETLVVKTEFQSQGFGTKFIEFAKQYTKQQGLATLHAYSFLDYNMVNFYVKKGFTMQDYMGNYQGKPYHCFELKV